jgi:hypothetical protein
MNALSEREVREQLTAALERLDPPPPPLDELQGRAKRRTRIRWGGAGVLAVAAAAVVVAVLVVVIPGNAGRGRVQPETMPSRSSLVAYAHQHGGLRIAGPIAPDNVGPGDQLPEAVGAFTTKRAIIVVEYHQNGGWAEPGGARVTSLGAGRFVTSLTADHVISPYSFAVRIVGGDVSYFGAEIRYDVKRQAWVPARFGKCGPGDCYPGTTVAYGHPDNDGFTSVQNNCTPYCAAGQQYRIQWAWRSRAAKFVAVRETPIYPR